MDDFIAALHALTTVSAEVTPAARVGAETLVAGVEGFNPYKGLRAFDEADAADFNGREHLINTILDRLAGTTRLAATGASTQPGAVTHDPRRLITLVGPSGSGKSSVVRAGLLPALRRGRVGGSHDWYVTTMVPGASPFDELAAALRRIATEQHPSLTAVLRGDRRGIVRGVQRVVGAENTAVLLVIDQFEELFTQVADEHERAAFIDALGEAVTMMGSPLRIVVTLRADFYDRPLRYPALAQLISDSTIVIRPLAPDELETAITHPAARAGVRFEPGLVAEIVADVGSQPGALPLLQYALTALFDRRADRVLHLDDYREMGGLAGAIAARAEELYIGARPEAQAATRRLMLRLVTLGEGTEDTRRRMRRAELGSDDDTSAVIDAFGAARLLSFDRDPSDREPTVEVAHEALIRQWPRLRDWLTEDRAGLRIHRALTVGAAAWEASGRDSGDLLRGARLIATEDWVHSHPDDLNPAETQLLAASSRPVTQPSPKSRSAMYARSARTGACAGSSPRPPSPRSPR